MQFTVAPASSQVCAAAIRTLLDHESHHNVIGIYRNLSKVPEDLNSHQNFTAIQGDLSDLNTVDFSGSDGLLLTTPTAFGSHNATEYTKQITDNVSAAVRIAGSVKRLVYISSIGAQHHEGVVSFSSRLLSRQLHACVACPQRLAQVVFSPCLLTQMKGEVKSNNESESAYRDLAPEVVFVRNSYFMDNWKTAVTTAKADPPFFYSTITPADFKLPMVCKLDIRLSPVLILLALQVSSRDIGATCAAELLSTGTELRESLRIVNQQGPKWYSTLDVQEALEIISGKSVELKLVDPDALPAFLGQVLPPHLVGDFVEMNISMLPGGVLEREIAAVTNPNLGQETLQDALTRFWEEGNTDQT